MALKIDKKKLLERLDHVKYEQKPEESRQKLSKVSLGAAMLTLAGINAEGEYSLCHRVVEHLLGEVPAPPEIDLDAGAADDSDRKAKE